MLESLNLLDNTQKQISSSNLNKSNPSLKLAEWITGIPIIYYPLGFQAAAIRFKNSLHENAKIPAIVGLVLVVVAYVVSQQKKLLILILKKCEKLPILKKLVSNALETYDAIQILLSSKAYAKNTMISVTGWIIESVAVYLALKGFGIDLSFPVVLFIHSVSLMIGAVSMLPWHFIEEFKLRETEFLKKGGKLLVPLPTFQIIGI